MKSQFRSSVIHRIDDLEITFSVPVISNCVVHRIDDLEKTRN